jgi:hypothetical protein
LKMTVPAVAATLPTALLAPESVTVPEPSLVKVPVPAAFESLQGVTWSEQDGGLCKRADEAQAAHCRDEMSHRWLRPQIYRMSPPTRRYEAGSAARAILLTPCDR